MINQFCDLPWAGRSGDRKPVGGRIFRTRPDRPWSQPRHLYSEYRVSVPEIKRFGRGADQPLPSTIEVTESVELHLCSSFGSSWPFIRWTLRYLCLFSIRGCNSAAAVRCDFCCIYVGSMSSDFEMRFRDTQICFRAVEYLNYREKVWAHQVSALFWNDHTSKFD
jgi:hypothetical protein